MEGHKILHISLFSGIGGFDLAADWMGWTNALSCEINPFGRNLLKYYWPQAYHHDNIYTLNETTIETQLSARFGSDWRKYPIVLTGGFPCQGFSVAGKRLGTDDERYLWPQMLRVINIVKPTWVLGENVTGILSMEDKSGVWSEVFPVVEARKIIRHNKIDEYEAIYSRQAKMLVATICETLEEAGFEVQPLAIPAGSIGLIHRRERIWFLAYSRSAGIGSESRELSNEGRATCQNWGEGLRQEDGQTGADRIETTTELRSNPNGFGYSGRKQYRNSVNEGREIYKNVENNGDGVRGETSTHSENATKPRTAKVSQDPNLSNDGELQTEGRFVFNGNTGTTSQDGNAPKNATHPHPDHSQAGSKQPKQPRPTPTGTGGEFYSDTSSPRLQELNPADLTSRQRYLTMGNLEDWTNWPTQPPICFGNDVISGNIHFTAISNERNNMDRDLVTKLCIEEGRLKADPETGKIYSLKQRGKEGQEIELPGCDCNGYIVHGIRYNGFKIQLRAHQIVWIFAHGVYDKSTLMIDHINRNRKDNRLCNLRLVDAQGNRDNATPYNGKLTDDQKDMLFILNKKHGIPIRELAKDFEISKSRVHQIIQEHSGACDITLTKWRNESIKGAGNAVAPAVVYQIFKAIDKNTKP